MMRSDVADAQRRKGLSLPNPMDFQNSVDGLVDSVMGIVCRYELVSVQVLVPQCLSRGGFEFSSKSLDTPHLSCTTRAPIQSGSSPQSAALQAEAPFLWGRSDNAVIHISPVPGA